MYIIKLLHSLESGFRILLILWPNEERTKIRHTRELVFYKKGITGGQPDIIIADNHLTHRGFHVEFKTIEITRYLINN